MSIVSGHIETNFPELRKKAKSQIDGLDFPTPKDEDWKYTKVGKLKTKSFLLEKKTITEFESCLTFPHSSVRLVFVNGYFDENSSINSSKYIRRIAEISEIELNQKLSQTGYIKEGIFTSYNDAFFTDGVLIEIPEGIKTNGIIEVLFISTGQSLATVTKNILIVHPKAETEILFNFQSLHANDNLLNYSFHAVMHPEAKAKVYKLQHECSGVSHFSSENVFQKESSIFEIHTVTLEGDLVRNDLSVKVDGENCLTHLGGVFIADKSMHVDNHTMVDHQKPNCESNEIYKGIANDNGVGVFNGKIFVRRDAQKINAYQNSANVLLSDDASIYSKPELEIYADDVKCSHGTTTGCLDEEALFYLQARGISQESARNLLVQAFAADMIEKIENDEMREWLIDLLNKKLEHK